MEQTPDIFRKGKVAYDELIMRLFNIYKLLPLTARKELFLDKSKKINDSIDATGFKNMKKDFNSVLQYSLLDCGTTTEKVSYLEMLFVADIGDFEEFRLDHYLLDNVRKNDKRFKDTYLMLPDLTPEEVVYYKSCLFEYVEPIRARLLKAFQIGRKVAKDDVMQDLLPSMADLYEAFLNVNHRIENEDPMVVANEMKEIFLNHIDDYKNKVKTLMK